MPEGTVLKSTMQEVMFINAMTEGALEQRSYIIKVKFYHAVPGNTVKVVV
jgi:hypothetical protein